MAAQTPPIVPPTDHSGMDRAPNTPALENISRLPASARNGGRVVALPELIGPNTHRSSSWTMK